MVFKWRDHHTEQFLELYKNYQFLWNSADPLYKNRVAREAAYSKIISLLKLPDLTVRDIKNKIKTIRTNYKYELNKILRAEKDGADPSNPYVPHLFWFKKADEFLREVCMNREEANQLNKDSLEDDTTYSLIDDNDTEVDECEIKVEEPEIQDQDEIKFQHFQNSSATTRSFSPTPCIKLRKDLKAIPVTEIVTIPSNSAKDVLSRLPDVTISRNEPKFPSSRIDRSPSLSSETGRTNDRYNCQTENDFTCCSAFTRKREHDGTSLEKSIIKLQKTIDCKYEQDKDDEFDLFGKSIAVQLKRMPLERALKCQETLQRVMSQERLQQNK